MESLKESNASAGASNSNAASVPPSTAQPTNVSFQSLPKVDVPKLSGNFSDWENFRDVFRSIIHHREQYYENQHRIVSFYVAEIFSVKPIKTDSSSEIKRIYPELYNPIASLISLNRADSLGSDLMVHFTLKQLDLNTRKEWERHLGDILATVSIHPQWSNFKPFFEVKYSLLRPSKQVLSPLRVITLKPNLQIQNRVSQSKIELILFILIKLHLRTDQTRNVRFVINLILQLNVNNFSIKRFLSERN